MIPMCKLLLLIIYKNFQILTQPLCCQNRSQSLPTNLKWIAQELLSCTHSLKAPAYWGYASSRETTGSPRLACTDISQNISTDIKKNLSKSHSHEMLGYFPLPPPSPRNCTFLRHTWQLTGQTNGCAKAGHELQEQLKALGFFLSGLDSGQQPSGGSQLTLIGINMKMHWYWHYL